MNQLEIFKFGGVSVGSVEYIKSSLHLCQDVTHPLVVVVSAMSGLTDRMLKSIEDAIEQNEKTSSIVSQEIRKRYFEFIEVFVKDAGKAQSLRTKVELAVDEFGQLCKSISVIGECSPRTKDVIVSRGEVLTAEVFAAALTDRGVKATAVDPMGCIRAQQEDFGVSPNFNDSLRLCRKSVFPLLEEKQVVLVPGFLASDPHGKLITLGRGGTDYSAAILAKVLKAKRVTLFKEVDGLLTSDPRVVPLARVIDQLHYREASELAYYGAKVLHPLTIAPLVEDKIELAIKNCLRPDFPGTSISAASHTNKFPVKAVSAVRGQSLITLEGKGMMGVPGIAGRSFQTVASAKISVSMISQASSENNICFVVPTQEAPDCVEALTKAFQKELDSGLLDRVNTKPGIAIVAAVGLGMKGSTGIAARTFSAVSRVETNIIAIAQGSSELNISFAVDEDQVEAVVNALHNEYQLDRMQAIPNRDQGSLGICVLGVGQIGRTLLEQLHEQQNYFQESLDVDLHCLGVSDSSGMVYSKSQMSLRFANKVCQNKAEGKSVSTAFSENESKWSEELGSVAFAGQQDLSQAIASISEYHNRGHRVLVDTTAADSFDLLLEAVRMGFHVVLANKKPLAVQQERYDELFKAAQVAGTQIRFEATVGAGLPLLDTLDKLDQAGDEIQSIEGCFSGTLGYIFTALEDGVPYSEVVKDAFDKGYTEPDPREDLSGMDVARKALILARRLGYRTNLSEMQIEALYTGAQDRDNAQEFLEQLKTLDVPMKERLDDASANEAVLRYVGRIEGGKASVSIEKVSIQSALGRLRGTNNQVTIKTRRYSKEPLIVTGPGAGDQVTAAGVLNDLIAIARMHKKDKA